MGGALLRAAAALVLAGSSSTASSHRIVAFGDLHGDFKHTVAILHAAGLAEELERAAPLTHPSDGRPLDQYRGVRWIGGNATLVQTGDLVDRGDFARDLYALFQDLREQARAAGGRVVNLIGNHEVMNLHGDLRYVSRGDINAFGGASARAAAFSTDGWVGRDILEEYDVAALLGQTVFVHAGLLPQYAGAGIDGLNKAAKEELRQAAAGKGIGELLRASGPFWVRRLTDSDEGTACPLLAQTLEMLGAERMVVGHTQVDDGVVRSKCSGKLLMVDTIISREGYPMCWEPNSRKRHGCIGSLSYLEIGSDGNVEVHVAPSGADEALKGEL